MRQIAITPGPDTIAAGQPGGTPIGLAAFAALAQGTDSLAGLTADFSATIAHEGMDGHLCIAMADGTGPTALFGDMHGIPAEALRIIRSRPDYPRAMVSGPDHGVVIPVQCWQERAMFVLVSGASAAPERAAIARLHGMAEVYATYGHSLYERQRDIATNVGLGLIQRRCLGLILTGHRDFEIAALLDITPLSVRAHVHHAMTLLEADTRAEAVAIAARRGWLVGLDQVYVTQLQRN